MTDKLDKLIQEAFDSANYASERRTTFTATLGRGDGTLTTDRVGYVWARVNLPAGVTPMIIKAHRVTIANGALVDVRRDVDGFYEAFRASTSKGSQEYWERYGTGNTPQHAPTHGLYGNDPLSIMSPQFLPLSVRPAAPSSTSVIVHRGVYRDSAGELQEFDTTTVDLADEIAALSGDEQQLVVLSLNLSDGTITKTTGTTVEDATDRVYCPFTGDNALAIAVADGEMALSAVRIYAGQTNIVRADIPEWLDMRNWFGGYAGAGGGNASQLVYSDTLATALSAQDDKLYFDGVPTFNITQNATLASGAFAVNAPYIVVSAETGTSDTLDTINGLAAGGTVFLYAATGHTITVGHQTGNINLDSGANIVLSETNPLVLQRNPKVSGYTVGDPNVATAGGGASQLTDLSDVSAASQTANYVLAAGDGSTGGDYRGRLLVAADIPNLPTSKITSGTFADALIAESNVTQHEAALSLTASQVSDFDTEVSNNTDVAANTTARHAHPISDATSLVEDPVDPTKEMRIDVGAVATGTVRVLTMPDRNVDLSAGGTFAENSHTHTAAAITDFDTEVSNNGDVAANTAARHTQGTDLALDTGNANEVTAADLRAHLDDADIHREINDAGTATTDLWSADKISDELALKADTSHTHAAGDIVSGTLVHERGGLEADVSAYSGLVKISGGATSQAVANTDYAAATHASRHESAGADAINHDNLTGFVANEHVDHSAVTFSAGSGLAGGGDLTANRSFSVDISPLSAIGTSDPANDLLLIEDVTDGSILKVTPNNLGIVSFKTITTDFGTSPVADSATDTLALTGGEGIATAGDSSTDTLTVGLAIYELTEDTTPAGTDFTVVVNALDQHHKVALDNLPVAAHATSHESGGSDEVNHDDLAGFVANEHIDHSTVSISAGDGLAGGGTIAANRTLSVDISPLTAIGTVDPANDLLIIEDVTDGSIKKVTPNNLGITGGSGTPAAVGVKANHNTTQSIGNASPTDVVFNTERYDTDAYHSTGSNTEQFVVPTGKAGKYDIAASVSWAANATGIRGAFILVNGNIVAGNYAPGVATFAGQVTITTQYDLAVGDVVKIQALQTSGGALNATATTTNFGMLLVGT